MTISTDTKMLFIKKEIEEKLNVRNDQLEEVR